MRNKGGFEGLSPEKDAGKPTGMVAFQCKGLSISPSKATLPRSCSVLAARVTSAVSNSSCLSGGRAAFMYATSAAIVSESAEV